MDNGMVSIIVPVYNVKKYLDQAILSAVSQTYSNIEIILVDDGSSDGSEKMCDEWVKRDTRVRCIHQTNCGVSKARNLALDMLHGQYVMFLDSDDWLEENYVELLINCKGQSQLVVGDFIEEVDADMEQPEFKHQIKEGIKKYRKEEFFNDCMDGMIYTYLVWGKLYDASLIGKTRFFELAYSEDAIFCRQILSKCETISFVNVAGYHYRISPDGVTANTLRIEEKNYGALVLACETYGIFKQVDSLIEEKSLIAMVDNILVVYLHSAIKYKIKDASKSKDIIETAYETIRELLETRKKMKRLLLICIVKIKCLISEGVEK